MSKLHVKEVVYLSESRIESWELADGEKLQFTVHELDTEWQKEAGVYIFVREDESGRHPLYVGKAKKSFVDRFSDHERWDEARELGMTAVHTRAVPLQADRDRLENLLIKHLQPPMNIQGK